MRKIKLCGNERLRPKIGGEKKNEQVVKTQVFIKITLSTAVNHRVK